MGTGSIKISICLIAFGNMKRVWFWFVRMPNYIVNFVNNSTE